MASQEVPDNFTATFAEELSPASPQAFSETTFLFTAPSSDLPANARTSGPDAQFFSILVTATDPPNAAGQRTITFRIMLATTLNYENPRDANGDNVYAFGFAIDYRGETLTANVAVTITDIPDAGETVATIIDGQGAGQYFGVPLSQVPDVTGDGKPELAASIQSGNGAASGYIIGSEFFASMPGGRLSIANLANAGSTFPQAASPGTKKINLVTAKASSSGVDVLYSDATQNKLYLFSLANAAAFAALRGAVVPDAIPNAIVYSFPPSTPVQEGRLIGDVNGDGVNDLFARRASAQIPNGQPPGSYGIILGRIATSPSDLLRTATFDIDLVYGVDPSATGAPLLVTELIPDVDGDGHRELAISRPSYSWPMGDAFNSANDLWIIRSSVLRGSTPASINLQSLTVAQGKKYAGGYTWNFFQHPDLDSDGFPTLLFQGRNGILHAVDAHDMLSLTFALGSIPEFGPLSYSMALGCANFMTEIGDLDGDSLADYICGNSANGTLRAIRGSTIRDALNTRSFFPNLTGLPINIGAGILPTVFEMRAPVVIGPTGQGQGGVIAIGVGAKNFAGTDVGMTPGMILLFKTDDLRRALTTGATSLLIR